VSKSFCPQCWRPSLQVPPHLDARRLAIWESRVERGIVPAGAPVPALPCAIHAWRRLAAALADEAKTKRTERRGSHDA